MNERTIINDFTDIIQRNREIIDAIKKTDNILHIAELVNESKEILELTYDRCRNRSMWGSLSLCQKRANENYNKVLQIASYRMSVIKRHQQKEQRRIYEQ